MCFFFLLNCKTIHTILAILKDDIGMDYLIFFALFKIVHINLDTPCLPKVELIKEMLLKLFNFYLMLLKLFLLYYM